MTHFDDARKWMTMTLDVRLFFFLSVLFKMYSFHFTYQIWNCWTIFAWLNVWCERWFWHSASIKCWNDECDGCSCSSSFICVCVCKREFFSLLLFLSFRFVLFCFVLLKQHKSNILEYVLLYSTLTLNICILLPLVMSCLMSIYFLQCCFRSFWMAKKENALTLPPRASQWRKYLLANGFSWWNRFPWHTDALTLFIYIYIHTCESVCVCLNSPVCQPRLMAYTFC